MAGKEFFKSGIESFRLFAVAVFGALIVTGVAPARAQTPVIRRIGNDSVVVIAGEIYRAGSLHRKLLGDNYRDEGTTPITVPALDLNTFRGGLTPTKQGVRLQDA